MVIKNFIHKVREKKRINNERFYEMQLNIGSINPLYRQPLTAEEKTLYKKMWGG